MYVISFIISISNQSFPIIQTYLNMLFCSPFQLVSFFHLKKKQLSPVSAANMFTDVEPFMRAQTTYKKSQPWEKLFSHISPHLSIIYSRGLGPYVGPTMPSLPSMLKFWLSLSCKGDKCCVLMIVISCSEDSPPQDLKLINFIPSFLLYSLSLREGIHDMDVYLGRNTPQSLILCT